MLAIAGMSLPVRWSLVLAPVPEARADVGSIERITMSDPV